MQKVFRRLISAQFVMRYASNRETLQVIENLTKTLDTSLHKQQDQHLPSNLLDPITTPITQTKPITSTDLKTLIPKIIQEGPTFATFRKHQIQIGAASLLLRKIENISEISAPGKIIFTNNLLTYSRKLWGRSFVKAHESQIDMIIKLLETQHIEDFGQVFPALIQNISYAFSPEQYLDRIAKLLLHNVSTLSAHQVSNSLYGLAKIARIRVQSNENPSSAAALTKVALYNSVQLTLIQLIPIILLTSWSSSRELVELLIAYQKLELTDSDGIGTFILQRLPEILALEDTYETHHAQLVHTLSLYDCTDQATKDLITGVTQKLMLKFVSSFEKQNLKNIVLSIHGFYSLDKNTIDKELLLKSMDIYCQRKSQSNIQDLGMILEMTFSYEIMTAQFSTAATENLEVLKQSIDIQFLNRVIMNMGSIINQRLLEKKFINILLIAVKILHEKGKLNQRFVKAFGVETDKITNQEIQTKFKQIYRQITH